jgi:hypothetical protein
MPDRQMAARPLQIGGQFGLDFCPVYIHNCHDDGRVGDSLETSERTESTGESTASVLKPRLWFLKIPGISLTSTAKWRGN